MGLIFLMVIVRPPCSWVVVARMSLGGTTNGGLGGAGGGGVPAGMLPRMPVTDLVPAKLPPWHKDLRPPTAREE